MKQRLMLLMFVMMLVSPTFVVADWGYPAIKRVATHNFRMHGLDYNESARILRAEASPYDDSWYNIGLAALEIQFNIDYPPQLIHLQITWMNETVEDPIDMLKNYTYIDGTYNYGNATYPDIIDCKYLLIYFYHFPNHSIVNECPMPNFIGAEWNYTDNITAPPQPACLAQDYTVAETGNVQLVIPVEGYIPPETTTPTTTTTTVPTEIPTWHIVFGLSVIAVAAVIVVVAFFLFRKPSNHI